MYVILLCAMHFIYLTTNCDTIAAKATVNTLAFTVNGISITHAVWRAISLRLNLMSISGKISKVGIKYYQ